VKTWCSREPLDADVGCFCKVFSKPYVGLRKSIKPNLYPAQAALNSGKGLRKQRGS
jgi:hypothetical protein